MKEYEWRDGKKFHKVVIPSRSLTRKDIERARSMDYKTARDMIVKNRAKYQSLLDDAKAEAKVDNTKIKAYTALIDRLDKYGYKFLSYTKGAPVAKKTTAKTKLPSNSMLNKCAFK